MKKVVGFLAIMAAVATVHAQQPDGKFEWSCKGTGRNSMQCAVKNNGPVDAEMCVDVVAVCKGGDHTATLCSGPLRSGETTSKVVRDFAPKIRLFESCMGVEYRDKRFFKN